MTDRDSMEEIRKHLAESDVPAPDPVARRAAISSAMAAFDEEQATEHKKNHGFLQGILRHLRPIVGKATDRRSIGMYYNPRIIMGGMGAACIGLVAVGIALQQPQDSATRYSPPAEKEIVDAVRAANEAPVSSRESDADFAGDFYQEVESAEKRARTGLPLSSERDAAKVVEDHRFADSLGIEARVGRSDLEEITVTANDAPRAERHRADGVAFMKVAPQMTAEGIIAPPAYQDAGRDRFESFEENVVKLVSEEPVSTFSIDVDTASYSFVRRQLNQGLLPQPDAVRVEEMINYFDYDYPVSNSIEQPFATTVALSDAPWAEGRQLLHVGIKGYQLAETEKPRSNLVFLLDVSGSMNSPDKLPLVKQSMELLLTTLDPDDTVSIAVYAGAAGTVLEPTPVKERQKILDSLSRLRAGGSTAGAQGIRLAYELAESNFDENAINRVILATDGDFNVGITNDSELQGFVERKRDKGIFLSVLGFGQGNYQDQMMQTLAQNGNGVATYIDTLSEAQKVLVTEGTSSLFPIAGDVKIQVEFNPATVAEYRLIGYETRHLNREDFNNDQVDAGDIGAGHTVTAIYEITPVGSAARQIEDLRYAPTAPTPGIGGSEYAFLKLRYKQPGESDSTLIERAVEPSQAASLSTGLQREVNFATAVAGFAQLLKGGKYTEDFSFDDVIALAQANKGADPYGYRTEFVQLARKAKTASALPRR